MIATATYVCDPIAVRERIETLARELSQLSTTLNAVQAELNGLEPEYQQFIDDFETGLYLKAEEAGKRLPSEALRIKLARREMRPELLGRRDGLRRKRERFVQRIRDLKVEINAEQSILSALKEEMSATNVPARGRYS